jgi:3-hydroxyisobutyrate dehydrogenase
MERAMKIGFINLGMMGQACTARLVECGHEVTGYDLQPEKIEAAAKHGVWPAASPGEAAFQVDCVMSSVTFTDAVDKAVFGLGGVTESGTAGKILIDLSTIETAATHAFAERLSRESATGWIDAPVSGGAEAAAAGTLAIMAGGAEAGLLKVESAIRDLAGGFTHMAPVGAGQVTKMVNQILVLNTYVVLAEALALAEAGGVDASKTSVGLANGRTHA